METPVRARRPAGSDVERERDLRAGTFLELGHAVIEERLELGIDLWVLRPLLVHQAAEFRQLADVRELRDGRT